MDEDQAMLIEALNLHLNSLGDFIIEQLPDGREKSLAITKLQECQMWGIQSIMLKEEPDA